MGRAYYHKTKLGKNLKTFTNRKNQLTNVHFNYSNDNVIKENKNQITN